MIRRVLSSSLALALTLLGAACADFAGPSEAVVDGLEVRLALDEHTLGPNDSVTARLSIVNTGQEPVRLSSAYSCIAFTGIYHQMQRVDLQGSSQGCLAVGRSFLIAPGESLADHWVLQAAMSDGRAARPGHYVLRLYFNVDGLPDLRHGFEVR